MRRLGWVGPLTVVASIAEVLILRAIAVVVLRTEPRYAVGPLGWVEPAIMTGVFVTIAVLVFALVTQMLLSFVPGIALGRWNTPQGKLAHRDRFDGDARRRVGRVRDDADETGDNERQ